MRICHFDVQLLIVRQGLDIGFDGCCVAQRYRGGDGHGVGNALLTTVDANAVFILVVTAVIFLIGIALAGGILCRGVNLVVGIAAKHRVFVCADLLPPNLRGSFARCLLHRLALFAAGTPPRR